MCVCVSVSQRYGLWDHEGPLEDKSSNEGEQAKSSRKEGEREEVCPISGPSLTDIEAKQLDQTQRNNPDPGLEHEPEPEPGTSSVPTQEPPASPSPSQSEQGPRKRSSFMRFHKKRQPSKGQHTMEGWMDRWMEGCVDVFINTLVFYCYDRFHRQ